MKKSTTLMLIALSMLASMLSSCEAIGKIFKAGMGFGIFIVVIIIVILVAVVMRAGKK